MRSARVRKLPISDQARQPHTAQRADSPAGTETKRGIDLALEELGNKLGGLPVRYFPVDEKSNPAEAVQGASKLIDDIKVDFVTGLGASNTLIPVFKSFADAGILLVGALAGPRQFAGKECHPNGFFISFTNDDWPAAAGKYMTDKGSRECSSSRPTIRPEKSTSTPRSDLQRPAIGPVYTPLTQLDFATEIARIRAEKPDAVFSSWSAVAASPFQAIRASRAAESDSVLTEDPVANPLTFPAQGDAALGIVMATNWHAGLDNEANKKFVCRLSKKHNRDPATFAALGYDAVKASTARSAASRQDRGQGRAARRAAQSQFPIGARQCSSSTTITIRSRTSS